MKNLIHYKEIYKIKEKMKLLLYKMMIFSLRILNSVNFILLVFLNKFN